MSEGTHLVDRVKQGQHSDLTEGAQKMSTVFDPGLRGTGKGDPGHPHLFTPFVQACIFVHVLEHREESTSSETVTSRNVVPRGEFS